MDMRVAMDVKAPGPGGPEGHGAQSNEQQTSNRLAGPFDNDWNVPAKYEDTRRARGQQQRVTQREPERNANRAGVPRLLPGRSGGQGGNRHEMISAETVKKTQCENRDAQHKGGII
jgi:hypothetical protein